MQPLTHHTSMQRGRLSCVLPLTVLQTLLSTTLSVTVVHSSSNSLCCVHAELLTLPNSASKRSVHLCSAGPPCKNIDKMTHLTALPKVVPGDTALQQNLADNHTKQNA